jgi:hypothetical protein
VVQDVVSGCTTIVTGQDFQDHDDAQICSDTYETFNWGEGQLDDTQSTQGTQITTHYFRCPTALMDQTFADEPSTREIASMNGVMLSDYLFSCYLQKPPEKARTLNLVVFNESVPCNMEDSNEKPMTSQAETQTGKRAEGKDDGRRYSSPDHCTSER